MPLTRPPARLSCGLVDSPDCRDFREAIGAIYSTLPRIERVTMPVDTFADLPGVSDALDELADWTETYNADLTDAQREESFGVTYGVTNGDYGCNCAVCLGKTALTAVLKELQNAETLRCRACHETTAEDYGTSDTGILCQHCRRNVYCTCQGCGALRTQRGTHRINLVHPEERPEDSVWFCPGCTANATNNGLSICTSCGSWTLEASERDGDCVACHHRETTGNGRTHSQSPGRPVTGGSCRETRSDRCFGVELEFSRCRKSKLVATQCGWGAKPDGTTGVVQEMFSPILQGDAGLASIRKLCKAAADRGWQVSAACGLHLHIDLRYDGNLEIARLGAAYQLFEPVWMLLVTPNRRVNRYCRPSDYPVDDMLRKDAKRFPYEMTGGDRYKAVNWEAYREHRTVEIRLHHGSRDARRIVNWIKVHLWFVDWAVNQTDESLAKWKRATNAAKWAKLVEIWDNRDVAAFWRDVASRFGHNMSAEALQPLYVNAGLIDREEYDNPAGGSPAVEETYSSDDEEEPYIDDDRDDDEEDDHEDD